MKIPKWKALLAGLLALGLLAACSSATDPGQLSSFVVYSHPADASGGLIASSRVSPGGSDLDAYAYDSFVLAIGTAINEVRWRGGYAVGGTYGHVNDFTLTFYASTANDTQPLCTNPHLPESTYLATYTVGGDAGETVVGDVGGTTMYDYSFVLPTPFQATAGTRYWLRIEAAQPALADWGIAVGIGTDSSYYRFLTGSMQFATVPGNDVSFTLLK